MDRAIATTKEAVESCTDDENLSIIISNLGEMYYSRFEKSKSRDDFDQAICTGELALSLASDDREQCAGVLRNLGVHLLTEFQRTGSIIDLERAIPAMEECVKYMSNEDPLRGAILNNLGVALQMRFERIKLIEDLSRGISMTKLALSCTGKTPDHFQYRQRVREMESVLSCSKILGADIETDVLSRDRASFHDLDDAISESQRQFKALVERSISAWYSLNYVGPSRYNDISKHIVILRESTSLDAILTEAKFWFFQSRRAFTRQTHFAKWDSERLDDFVLLPAINGFVNKQDCFFVSHFWRTTEHPDPDGKDLRDIQNDPSPLKWSYIWLDWTCLPQGQRSESETMYFKTMLQGMPQLIRESAMGYRFPAFQPRAWVLMEMAQYILLSLGEMIVTEDLAPFFAHIQEMIHEGVQPVLIKHAYKCTNETDLIVIVGWLELLITLSKLVPDVVRRRQILTYVDQEGAGTVTLYEETPEDRIGIDKVRGIISYRGVDYEFTPVYNIRRGGHHRVTIQ